MREDKFSDRHIGPRSNEIDEMLKTAGANSLDELIPAEDKFPGQVHQRVQEIYIDAKGAYWF